MIQPSDKLATASERICTYLGNYQSYEDEMEGPFELTQIGIAEAVGIARGNVTRAMVPFIKKKWIETRKVHIPGIRLKRNIYYLCPNGRPEVNNWEKSILKKHIRVIDIHGDSSIQMVRDVIDNLVFDNPMTVVLREVSKSGFLDMRTLVSKGNQAVRQTVQESSSKHFYGRTGEIARIRAWLKSKTKKTLIIQGMPGIGKSTLLANIMSEITVTHKKMFFNITPWCALRPLAQLMSGAFEELGRSELKMYLKENDVIEIHDLEFILFEIMKDQKIIMIFDNFQNVNAELKNFFSMLNGVIDISNGPKLIILGRNIEPFFEMAAIGIDGSVVEISLGGLNEHDSSLLAQSYGVSGVRVSTILENAAGHPLFIELLVLGDSVEGKMNIERFISEEFQKALNKEEMELLRYLSVFRFPVERNALRFYQSPVFGLLKKSILKQSADEFIILHDMIRDSLYRQLSEKELAKFHTRAAEYYLESPQISSQMEALHHLLYAGRADAAANFMLGKIDKLLKTANMESLARILTILLSRDIKIDSKNRATLFYAQGTALAFIGEIDSAMEHFSRSIELVGEDQDNVITVKCKQGIAKVMLRRNKYEESEVLFREILGWANKHKELEMEAEINYRLGAIYERLGIPEQALRHFKNAWNISLKQNDKNQLAQAMYGIARMHQTDSNYEKALEHKNNALEIALQNGNEHMASKILTSIARTLSEMGRLNEAIDANERAIGLARKSGAVRVLAYTLSNAGAAYIDKPNLNQASEHLEEALLLFEKLGERRMIAKVKLNSAVIAVLRGRLKEGNELFREVKLILESLKDNYELMMAYFKFGQTMKKVNQFAQATKLLKKAMHISQETKDSEASEQILQEMQGLLDMA